MSEFSGWTNFYVIVGSSAGALIGLQFVMISLIAQIPAGAGGEQAGQAFATPTIVHFSVVLLVAAILNAPWHGIVSAPVAWGAVGVCGFAYAAVVSQRMRRQSAYRPQFEDWVFHAILPLTAYGTLAASAFAAPAHLRGALFGVAGAVLLLLFIGIHNAWDAATYHVFVVKPARDRRAKADSSANG
jgi:hypothetical protein